MSRRSTLAIDDGWEYLEFETRRITTELQGVSDRFAEVLPDEVETAVARLEIDPLWELLSMLPDLAQAFQQEHPPLEHVEEGEHQRRGRPAV